MKSRVFLAEFNFLKTVLNRSILVVPKLSRTQFEKQIISSLDFLKFCGNCTQIVWVCYKITFRFVLAVLPILPDKNKWNDQSCNYFFKSI